MNTILEFVRHEQKTTPESLQQVMDMLSDGIKVYWSNESYQVKSCKYNGLLVCHENGYCTVITEDDLKDLFYK